MRRLRTWLSESLNMDCLRSLASMNIHRDMGLISRKLQKKYLDIHPQKINENNLIHV